MSFFSGKRPRGRQFRRKVVHSVEENEEEETQQEHPAEEPTKNENTPLQDDTEKEPNVSSKLLSSRPALSFNDDLEEDEVFQVKKTNHSKRVAKMMEREKRKEKRLKEAIQLESHEDGDKDEAKEAPLFSLSHRLGSGVIPDAAMVHAARKKREILRKLGGGITTQDHMTLEVNNESAKGKSRLIREDEYDKSDDSDNEEEGPARTFGRRSDTSRQMKVLEALENAESGSDEDRFEEEQINKGVRVNVPTSRAPPSTAQPLSLVDHTHLYPGLADFTPSISPPAPVNQQDITNQMNRLQLPEKLVPITMDSLKSRLQNQLKDVRETHSSHRQRLERMEDDCTTAEREIAELEEHTASVSVDYQFYQQMRGYIRDLLYCLTEKNVVIDGLERSLHAALRERADLLVERRRQDVRDQAEECTTTTTMDATGKQPGGMEARQLRSVEREGRRRRRREKRGVGGAPHYDGTSSDDELLETNRMKFISDIDKVVTESEGVFSDVVEDFCKLTIIKERFEQWKFHLPSSYSQAFVSLCLPKIFTPFVRLQLFPWNPLDPHCPLELEDMTWFSLLMFYGFREGHDLDPEDEDLQLIPRLVEQAVVPKITALVEGVWDPLSSSQTLRLVSLVQQLMEDYPTITPDNTPTRSLINAAILKLRQAIDNDVYIPLFASKQLENPSSPRYLFYQRQFWSCLKLLGNITQWAGLIDQDILQELVFDGLLNRYLLLSLQNCPISLLSVTKAQTVISTLPSSWFKDSGVVRRSLQGLVRFLLHLVEQLHRAAATQTDLERANTRRGIQTVVGLLMRVGAKSEASEVAQEHGLTDVVKRT